MIANWREHFRETIHDGLILLATLNKVVCQREQYLGNSPELDILYARSVVVSGLIERIMNSDGSTEEYDRELLLCLRRIVSDKNNFCTTKKYC